MPQRIILGFVGPIASGKGTACEYLEQKYSAVKFRFSTILRDILDRIYLDQSRENMQSLSQSLRETFGQDVLARAIAEDIKKSSASLIVVDGVRRPMDLAFLRQIPGFTLVAIDADLKIRHQRIVARGENVDDAAKTFEQFKIDHAAEAELLIPDLMKEARQTIDNNGSAEQLQAQLDRLITKLRNEGQS